MKRMNAVLWVCLSALLFFALSAQAMSGSPEAKSEPEVGQSMTLSGQVIRGQLITNDGHTVMLSGDKAVEMEQWSGQKVEITGTVLEFDEEGGPAAIEVQSYTPLEE